MSKEILIAGSGFMGTSMAHALENCNIDSNKYSGLALGLGIERISMLKYGVSDIREFYKSNLDFLTQFK